MRTMLRAFTIVRNRAVARIAMILLTVHLICVIEIAK